MISVNTKIHDKFWFECNEENFKRYRVGFN